MALHAPLLPREQHLARRAAGEEVVGLDGLVEAEGVGYQVAERDAAVDDEVGGLGESAGTEGPRAIDGELPVDDLPADVECRRVALLGTSVRGRSPGSSRS